MKTDHLVNVLSLRLTEQHYFEACGWKKFVEPDTSWVMETKDEIIPFCDTCKQEISKSEVLEHQLLGHCVGEIVKIK